MFKKSVRSFALTAAIATMTIAPAIAAESVGGGLWNHGHDGHGWTGRLVYSNYYHGTNTHSGTAICGGNQQTIRKAPKVWANAQATCGFFDSIEAWYNPKA